MGLVFEVWAPLAVRLRPLFSTSHPFVVLDVFRVPHRIAGDSGAPPGCGRVRVPATGRTLSWLRDPAGTVGGRYTLGGLTVCARVLPDAAAAALLGSGWSPSGAILGLDGERGGSLWRDEGGSCFLPFDPSESIGAYWSEEYLALSGAQASRARGLAMHGYYRVRPLLPRRVQIALRRAFARIQARTQFPRWPAETALHDLYAFLLGELAALADEPMPYVAPWPKERDWALVLTHDVERAAGYRGLHLLRDVEIEMGFRSAWNFVPERDYEVEDSVVRELGANGFEVGVHGLHHDGRDLESRATLEARLPAIRSYAERWGAVGFRSPATHRRWEWMPLLGFEWDSSYPDTDPFEPQGGGCCSWLPFFNEELVELPLTLPQDHTLFAILRKEDEGPWIEKTTFLRERGGMALLNTHPDYLLEPKLVDVYRRYLEHFAPDERCWRALPREVAAWWRRRAETNLVRDGRTWRLDGPAADEARIELVSGGYAA